MHSKYIHSFLAFVRSTVRVRYTYVSTEYDKRYTLSVRGGSSSLTTKSIGFSKVDFITSSLRSHSTATTRFATRNLMEIYQMSNEQIEEFPTPPLLRTYKTHCHRVERCRLSQQEAEVSILPTTPSRTIEQSILIFARLPAAGTEAITL